MNWAELQEEAARLSFVPGTQGLMPPPNWATYTNRAHKEFSWHVEYNIEDLTVATVLNQAEYTLTGSPWKGFFEVLYGIDRALDKATEARIRRENPLWRMDAASTPYCYYLSTPTKLRVHPKPDAAAINMYLRGIREAPALSSVTPGTTDIPPFAELWHPAIAHQAALYHLRSMLIRTDDEALQKSVAGQIAMCESEYNRLRDDFKGWIGSNDATLVRYTRPRLPERVRV